MQAIPAVICRVTLVASVMLLSACQHKPTVHVYANELTIAQQQVLYQQLAQHNIVYELSGAAIPERYEGARLNKFPPQTDEKLFSQLREVVAALGYSQLYISDFNQENHTYSEHHYGLYLRGSVRETPLPEQLFALNCAQNERKLNLNHNGSWQLESTKQYGYWRFTRPYLTLSAGSGEYLEEQSYQWHDGEVVTFFGKKPAVTLVALGHRKKMNEALNCDWQVILVD